METLNVDGMQRNRRLARALSDAGMAEFMRQLEYKCEWHGTEFRRVDRWYPSSNVQWLRSREAVAPASERTCRYNRCGFECDRDENAARNIQAYTGHSEPARPLDGVVLDADANAACNILARLYDDEITLYTPFREIKALLAERTRTAVETALPGLELRGPATAPPSTESEVPAPVPECTS